jgi:hypothetical protein
MWIDNTSPSYHSRRQVSSRPLLSAGSPGPAAGDKVKSNGSAPNVSWPYGWAAHSGGAAEYALPGLLTRGNQTLAADLPGTSLELLNNLRRHAARALQVGGR